MIQGWWVVSTVMYLRVTFIFGSVYSGIESYLISEDDDTCPTAVFCVYKIFGLLLRICFEKKNIDTSFFSCMVAEFNDGQGVGKASVANFMRGSLKN